MKENLFEKFKKWITELKKAFLIIYLAYKDSRTPFYAKCLAFIIIAYASSPIDLIPDFIPVLGYLDDLIIVPLGIYLCLKLIPNEVLIDLSHQANNYKLNKSKNWFMAVIIIIFWLLIAVWITKLFISYL